jgi:endonuclease-3
MATSSSNKAAVATKSALIAGLLEKYFPVVPIPLVHSDAFTLLVAVMLSAQSTDARVNLVTPALFAAAPDAPSMAALEEQEILDIIKTVGLAPTKARHLKAMAQMLVEKFAGQVPRTFAELESLPGVGHKTASVVMSQAFGVPAFPVDTHIHRLAARWGLSQGKNVVQTERDLKAAFPESSWNKLHLQMIYFGRKYCPARGHVIQDCPICRELDIIL